MVGGGVEGAHGAGQQGALGDADPGAVGVDARGARRRTPSAGRRATCGTRRARGAGTGWACGRGYVGPRGRPDRPDVRRHPGRGGPGAPRGYAVRRSSRSRCDGRPVTLKLELLQHSGSFKVRGAFHSVLSAPEPPATLVAASGGNHGLAVAHVGHRARHRRPGSSCRRTRPAVKVDAIAALGAEVNRVGVHLRRGARRQPRGRRSARCAGAARLRLVRHRRRPGDARRGDRPSSCPTSTPCSSPWAAAGSSPG